MPNVTLPETDSKFAPENGRLEYFLVSFWDGGYSQGRLLLFLGRVPFGAVPHGFGDVCLRSFGQGTHLSHEKKNFLLSIILVG